MSFSSGDVLLVPVVFSDGSGHKKRPVVVVFDSGDVDLLVVELEAWQPSNPVGWSSRAEAQQV
jgi:hypothetical protein